MSTTTGTKFADLISKSDADKQSEEVKFAVDDAKIQLESDIQSAKKNISSKTRALAQAKSRVSFSSSAIIEASRELKLAKADLDDLTALMSELF